ncbi:uncharacterized protein BDV14DRAFT_162733 [Aspergillus stella-maris]|uniref:uncharacterized protein n=1 Tax=Aspergillus stella-maris TaxID=1810926 RepID=UPI003CCDFA53
MWVYHDPAIQSWRQSKPEGLWKFRMKARLTYQDTNWFGARDGTIADKLCKVIRMILITALWSTKPAPLLRCEITTVV